MSLTFHHTFRLERTNIISLLKCVDKNPHITNQEIHELTGIGIGKNPNKGKVQPTIDYATFSGLLTVNKDQGNRSIKFTDVGRLIYQYDRRLKNRVTHWIMHYHLTKKGSSAKAWSFFFNEFLPNRGDFTRLEFEREIEDRFGDTVKLKSINPFLLLACYTDEIEGLGKLRLIRETNKKVYIRSKSDIPNCYVLGYILAEFWEMHYKERITLDASTLMEPGNLASIMGLDETGMQKWLDVLTVHNIIEQMRAVSPFQIVKLWDDSSSDQNSKLKILEKSYQMKRL